MSPNFNSIEQSRLPGRQKTGAGTNPSDFCMPYFKLRTWKRIDFHVEQWASGKIGCSRVLAGIEWSSQ